MHKAGASQTTFKCLLPSWSCLVQCPHTSFSTSSFLYLAYRQAFLQSTCMTMSIIGVDPRGFMQVYNVLCGLCSSRVPSPKPQRSPYIPRYEPMNPSHPCFCPCHPSFLSPLKTLRGWKSFAFSPPMAPNGPHFLPVLNPCDQSLWLRKAV